MHVAQFLNALLLLENIEIVESRLPEAPRCGIREEHVLASVALASPERAARTRLFECFDRRRKVLALRLGDQQVKVLGHDDVTDDTKAVRDPRLFKDVQDEIATSCGTEKRTPTVTAERDEVKVSFSVIAL